MYRKPVRHSFKVFSEDLKNGNTGMVILMHGVEQYLVKWAVESLVKKYVTPAALSIDFVELSETASCSQIIEACETFSLFSQKRIVCVKDFNALRSDTPKGYSSEDLAQLIHYIENPSDGTVLIFSSEEVKMSTALCTALKKHGRVYDFDQIDKADFQAFARKRFRAAGIEISPRMLALLIDETGYFNKESDYRLFHFANDIQKVIAHCEGSEVTERDITETVSGDLETFVFDLLDAIAGGRKDRAFQILYNILHGGRDVFSVIGVIVSQFEMLLSVRQMRDDGMDLAAMHRKLGGSEYRIRKMLPHATKYSSDKLKKTLSAIYETNRKIKTGLLDSRTALELFIAGI